MEVGSYFESELNNGNNAISLLSIQLTCESDSWDKT